MKAIRFHEYGDADVLSYEDVEPPVPGAGQVRVRVAGRRSTASTPTSARATCRARCRSRSPTSPGLDVAGTVDALGEGVDRPRGRRPGRRLPALRRRRRRPPSTSSPRPTSLAAAPDHHPAGRRGRAAGGRPHRLAGPASTTPGSGPGSASWSTARAAPSAAYAVQLAKAAGAHVVATASARSQERLRRRGADEVVDHTTDRRDRGADRAGRRRCSTSRPSPPSSSRRWPACVARRRRRGQHDRVDAGPERRGARRARHRPLRPQRRRPARRARGAASTAASSSSTSRERVRAAGPRRRSTPARPPARWRARSSSYRDPGRAVCPAVRRGRLLPCQGPDPSRASRSQQPCC